MQLSAHLVQGGSLIYIGDPSVAFISGINIPNFILGDTMALFGASPEVSVSDKVLFDMSFAAGIRILGINYFPDMHAIECRINAEDPFKDFRPSPGTITTFHAPGGHGIRLDTHVYAGYTIPPNYDSMIAKLIVTAQTREEAISKMKRALDEFVIEGVKTTIPFHRQLMDDPDYIAGNFTTKFMEDFKLKAE